MRTHGVFALVGAVVVAVNALTGGEAIAHRWAQASAVIDTIAGLGDAVAVERDDDEGDRCHAKVRVRREVVLPRTRVVIRRRWTCRA